ncbi:MAG: OmpA family protein [Solirubrobacterales bacterium]|nr:OmpA family protein [Solirubrobacterales bacterium]
MARHGGGGRRRGGHGGGDHDGGDERWLLSYADMMTLLVALFMVLFSISSVNKSKLEGLQKSLKDAFSGKVLPGGEAIMEAGGAPTDRRVIAPPQTTPPQPQMGGATAGMSQAQRDAAQQAEARDFSKLKARLDAFARQAGIAGQVSTRITRDGLHIRILTDKLLFDSGSATPKDGSLPLLAKVGSMLAAERTHAVMVEGHTDDVPIASSQFPTNWELSAARASAVVRAMLVAHVSPDRLTASGRADRDAMTSNATAGGRAVNRRVEILLPREATDVAAPRAASTASVVPDLTHPLGTRIVPHPATEAPKP